MKRTAWNANMGNGKHTQMAENQMGPLPTVAFYKKERDRLQKMYKNNEITKEEMNQQLRVLRGMV